MPNATPAALDAQVDIDRPSTLAPARSVSAVRTNSRLSIHGDLSAIEREWRAFEQVADCTVFQSFDWLSTWQRHIGARHGVIPAVVAGRDVDGALSFLIPLAIETEGFARRLSWLGSGLCDYNAPLLAVDFSSRVNRNGFEPVWRDIVQRLQSHPDLYFDLIHFEKMPETVGGQPNPMLGLRVAPNPNGAYLTRLSDDWEAFYAAKRSSSTRRRDRTKRKKLSESGEVRFVSPENASDIARTLDTLIEQKTRLFRHMGVANIFARPGYREFYQAMATSPATRHLVHVSRLDVGAAAAAVNLGLTFRGSYYHLLASYDDGELSRFGPGAAHMHELLHYAIDRGFRVFDFTIGDERYKREWCDTQITLYDHISAATLRGACAALPLMALRGLKRRIKQTPALWDAASRLRALLGSLRRRAGA